MKRGPSHTRAVTLMTRTEPPPRGTVTDVRDAPAGAGPADVAHAPRRRRRGWPRSRRDVQGLLALTGPLVEHHTEDDHRAEAARAQPEKDEHHPERDVEVVVVGVRAEQDEQATGDERQGGDPETEHLAGELSDRHVPSHG